MLYTVSADALQRCRLMLDTPAHERVERGRAAVKGGRPSYERGHSQEECRKSGHAALDLKRSVKDQPTQLRQASTEPARCVDSKPQSATRYGTRSAESNNSFGRTWLAR